VALGTDGYGRSDTRDALRRHFEIDAEHMVVATLHALMLDGKVRPRRSRRPSRSTACQPDHIDPREA
jgi:pyruvate dehydrogenase E1 component